MSELNVTMFGLSPMRTICTAHHICTRADKDTRCLLKRKQERPQQEQQRHQQQEQEESGRGWDYSHTRQIPAAASKELQEQLYGLKLGRRSSRPP